IEIAAPERLTFTYGFTSGKPIAPGSSVVTIRLEPVGAGTRLHLNHAFSDAAVRDEHVQGWRYQLSLFANVVSSEVQAGAAGAVDAWLAAWSEADRTARTEALSRVAEPTVTFRDRYSCIDGTGDLHVHLEAA